MRPGPKRAAGLRVQPDRRAGRLEPRHALGEQPADQAGQHVARAGGGEIGRAVRVDRRAPVRRGDRPCRRPSGPRPRPSAAAAARARSSFDAALEHRRRSPLEQPARTRPSCGVSTTGCLAPGADRAPRALGARPRSSSARRRRAPSRGRPRAPPRPSARRLADAERRARATTALKRSSVEQVGELVGVVADPQHDRGEMRGVDRQRAARTSRRVTSPAPIRSAARAASRAAPVRVGRPGQRRRVAAVVFVARLGGRGNSGRHSAGPFATGLGAEPGDDGVGCRYRRPATAPRMVRPGQSRWPGFRRTKVDGPRRPDRDAPDRRPYRRRARTARRPPGPAGRSRSTRSTSVARRAVEIARDSPAPNSASTTRSAALGLGACRRRRSAPVPAGGGRGRVARSARPDRRAARRSTAEPRAARCRGRDEAVAAVVAGPAQRRARGPPGAQPRRPRSRPRPPRRPGASASSPACRRRSRRRSARAHLGRSVSSSQRRIAPCVGLRRMRGTMCATRPDSASAFCLGANDAMAAGPGSAMLRAARSGRIRR